jgi:hypothetical protein
MFAEDNCINLNNKLTNMNCFNLNDKLTNMNCNNLNDKLEYIKSPCNKLQNFMIDEPKINNNMRLYNNTNAPLVLNSGNGSGGSGSSNSMFSFFSIFNNLFSSNNSFEISEKNNEDSFYSVKGFPVYLLIFITIIVNIFIAIILTPVISVGIFIIIFLILIVAMLLLYMLTK